MIRYRHILCGEHCLTSTTGQRMVPGPGITRKGWEWRTPDGQTLTLPHGFIRCAACGHELQWNFNAPLGVKEMPA